jgi:hypothetical protein
MLYESWLVFFGNYAPIVSVTSHSVLRCIPGWFTVFLFPSFSIGEGVFYVVGGTGAVVPQTHVVHGYFAEKYSA